MTRLFLMLLVLTLTACATANSPIASVLLHDYEAAQKNFEAAAAQSAPDSVTQKKLLVAAQCMKDNVARLSVASATAADREVAGLISVGALAYIDTLTLQDRLAATSDGTASCDQLTGQIVRGVNSKLLKALPLRALN